MSAVERAVRELSDPDEAKRERARRRLIELRTVASGAVKDLLQNGPDQARVEAARILWEWGNADADTVSDLIRALRDTHPPVKRWATLALGRAKTKGAIVALLPLLQDDDLASIAARALAEAGDKMAEPALLEALRSLGDKDSPQDWLARFWIAIALFRLGSRATEVTVALQRVMTRHYPPGHHTWPHLRVDALRALQEIGALDVSSLEGLLQAESAEVRLAAARAALSGALQSSARRVLEEIANGRFGPGLKKEAAALLATVAQ